MSRSRSVTNIGGFQITRHRTPTMPFEKTACAIALTLGDDNDFIAVTPGGKTNPNQWFVFAFTDADLAGSAFVNQQWCPAGRAARSVSFCPELERLVGANDLLQDVARARQRVVLAQRPRGCC
jgi:hypothetical protein